MDKIKPPRRIGTHVDFTRAGKVLRVVKVRRNDYHARPEPYVRPNADGPSFTRWGDFEQIREDIAHWLDSGELPYSGGMCC